MSRPIKWINDEQTTIPALLARAASLWPDRVYLKDASRQLTFAEVDHEVSRLATGLTGKGVEPGDRVCTLLDTGIDAVLIWFAINRAGAISAPVNTSYKGEYLRHQISDCGAQIVIAETEYLDRVKEVADGLPAVQRIVHHGPAPETAMPWPVFAFEDLYAASPRPIPIAPTPDELSMLIYTSGTTGPSKGCMISHSYACFHAQNMIVAHTMRAGDVVWMPLPLFHLTGTCGLTLAALIQGATVALIRRFSVSNFWTEIEETGANFVLAMGSMLALIAKAPDNDAQKRCFGQIRALVGAPFEGGIRAIWRDRFGVKQMASPGYGLTEITIVTRHELGQPQPEGTSGKRFADYDVRIIDDDGAECPPGVSGEVIMRPMRPGIMFSGYWNKPAETLNVMRDLWFHSGDIGMFDDEGYFHFIDRKKDYLRKGGENISSVEMEAVFRGHPDVHDVAIHAVPSALAEDDVKATIVLRENVDCDPRSLCLWAIDRIPAFAVPRYIEFRPTLPRTPTGKVMKVELRTEGVTPQTWDREQSDIALRPAVKAD